MRIVGDVGGGRLCGHHVRVQRAVKVHRMQQRAHRVELFAAFRAQQRAQAHRVVEATPDACGADGQLREDAVDRLGKRRGDLRAFLAAQRGNARHLHRQTGRVALTAVEHRLKLMLQRAVQRAGIGAVVGQRMRVDERMERGVRRVVGDEAAGVGAGERAAGAGIAQGEHEIVGLLRVQHGAELRRDGLARQGEQGIEEGVRPLASGAHGAAQRRFGIEGKVVAGGVRDALMNVGCGHDEPPKMQSAARCRSAIIHARARFVD